MKILLSTVLLSGFCLSAGLVITSEALACDIPAQTNTKTPPKK